MSDASEVNPGLAKTSEAHPLDALTGGAFSAETSGERASRIRDWLASQPAPEQLQEVFKELSVRDKSAARAVRERLDEIRRLANQEKIAVEWAEKAQRLLAAKTLNIADAIAWQREAARAGAPLSREPLSAFKSQLAERVKVIEDLQHRVQVQREAAVLLAQRIEVLSTKPWGDALAALAALSTDVAHWQEQAAELASDVNWVSVDAKFPPQLESSRAQLLVVWEAFQSALALTQAAVQDEQAPLPPVPLWADELRVARGQPLEAVPQAKAPVAPRARAAAKAAPEVVDAAVQAVREALAQLLAAAPVGADAAEPSQALAGLRAALKSHGRFIDQELGAQVNAALLAAGDAQGWQGWNVDAVREDLVSQAEALLSRPEGQALGGRKMQELLRQLRERWKQVDQGAAVNHALWKRFDDACNSAHKVVEAWLEHVRSEAVHNKAQRLQLIEEIKVWAAAQTEPQQDWKAVARSLRLFGERWRDGGHVGEKVFAELQPLWKQAIVAAEAPLHAAQKASLQRRHAMIDEAVALGEAAVLRIDAVKSLQQRWQAEAQAVPLDRKHEQKLWDAFRKPLDDAFNRRGSERSSHVHVNLNEHDRQVLDAAKALEEANSRGDAQQIRAAMTALEAALRGQAQASKEAAPVVAADDAPKTVAAAKPVVAVRGDDRPGMKKEAPAARAARAAERPGQRDGRERTGRFEREERGPRLADPAFRAQRDALEHAQMALRKLAFQAHGEALTQLLAAWEKRDAEQLPSAQELGSRVTQQQRTAWTKSLSAPAAGDAGQALLRLEIAADVPTPAELITARRALQLQLLTRRNDPAPAQTWGQDVANVLASARDEVSARRLQGVLRALLKK